MKTFKLKQNILRNSGHFVPQQRPRAAHALRADQNLILTPTPHVMSHSGIVKKGGGLTATDRVALLVD